MNLEDVWSGAWACKSDVSFNVWDSSADSESDAVLSWVNDSLLKEKEINIQNDGLEKQETGIQKVLWS